MIQVFSLPKVSDPRTHTPVCVFVCVRVPGSESCLEHESHTGSIQSCVPKLGELRLRIQVLTRVLTCSDHITYTQEAAGKTDAEMRC